MCGNTKNKLGDNCVIENNVEIGNNVFIGNNVRICEGSIIGDDVKIFDGVIIGSLAHDVKYNREAINLKGSTIIGKGSVIREYTKVGRGTTQRKGVTTIGDNCYIMSYCHVGHDSYIDNGVTIANSTQIGGNTKIDKKATIGGGSLIHQNSNIGEYSMVGAGSFIAKDVLPYTTVTGNPAKYRTLNYIGLKRNNFKKEEIDIIKFIYDEISKSEVFSSGINNIIDNLKPKDISIVWKYLRVIYYFIYNNKRGLILPKKIKYV